MNLGFLKEGLELRINATFIIGAIILLAVWNIQHYGILRTARIQTILTVGALLPLLLVAIVPIFQGSVVMSNFSPFVPINGAWDNGGLDTLPRCDVHRRLVYLWVRDRRVLHERVQEPRAGTCPKRSSGLACSACSCSSWSRSCSRACSAQRDAGLRTSTRDAGIGAALASMVSAGAFLTKVIVVLLVFTLLLAIMTAMSGSSRTIFQGGQDGWLPKYLSHLNNHHVPTYAMWTDLTFNLILLLMSDYVFVLAVSNVNYLIFNFLNLNAGWIHRIDNPRCRGRTRPPCRSSCAGVAMAYVNAFLMGAGANVWGSSTLLLGWIAALISIPVFLYRHYVTDKGKFPDHMLGDLVLEGETELGPTKAGVLPYVAIAAGLSVMLTGWAIFGR